MEVNSTLTLAINRRKVGRVSMHGILTFSVCPSALRVTIMKLFGPLREGLSRALERNRRVKEENAWLEIWRFLWQAAS